MRRTMRRGQTSVKVDVNITNHQEVIQKTDLMGEKKNSLESLELLDKILHKIRKKKTILKLNGGLCLLTMIVISILGMMYGTNLLLLKEQGEGVKNILRCDSICKLLTSGDFVYAIISLAIVLIILYFIAKLERKEYKKIKEFIEKQTVGFSGISQATFKQMKERIDFEIADTENFVVTEAASLLGAVLLSVIGYNDSWNIVLVKIPLAAYMITFIYLYLNRLIRIRRQTLIILCNTVELLQVEEVKYEGGEKSEVFNK